MRLSDIEIKKVRLIPRNVSWIGHPHMMTFLPLLPPTANLSNQKTALRPEAQMEKYQPSKAYPRIHLNRTLSIPWSRNTDPRCPKMIAILSRRMLANKYPETNYGYCNFKTALSSESSRTATTDWET